MADGKDPKAEGEYEFKLPDFDEDTFIHREIVSFKTTAILVGWAVVAAGVSWAFFAAVDANPASGWLGGVAIAGAFGFALKWLFPKLGADIAHFKRREWFGTGSMFAMAWLSFFIIAINPPVSDFSPPRLDLAADPPVQAPGEAVTIHVLASDNADAAPPTVTVKRDGADVPVQVQPAGRDGHYEARIESAAAGRYEVQATTSDGRREAKADLAFTVGGAAFRVETRGRLESLADRVVVRLEAAPAAALEPCTDDDVRQARPCLRAVRLAHADGSGAVTLEPLGDRQWAADAGFAGWKAGNNTMRVEAEFLDHYLGARRIDGGTFRSDAQHNITVTAPVGSRQVSVLPDPVARPVNIAAPAAILVGIVLLAAAGVARRRPERFWAQ